MRRSFALFVMVALAACMLGQISPPATLAANPNIGYVDFGFGKGIGESSEHAGSVIKKNGELFGDLHNRN